MPPTTQQPSAHPHIPQTAIRTSAPPARQEKRTVTLFFCYARIDETLLRKLKAQLLPLQKQGIITMWYDRDISAGAEWEHEINVQLNTAEVILLLVSPDFLA